MMTLLEIQEKALDEILAADEISVLLIENGYPRQKRIDFFAEHRKSIKRGFINALKEEYGSSRIIEFKQP